MKTSDPTRAYVSCYFAMLTLARERSWANTQRYLPNCRRRATPIHSKTGFIAPTGGLGWDSIADNSRRFTVFLDF